MNKASLILLVRPVTVCDDEGNEPAACRRYEKEVAAVYAQAGIQVIWLPLEYFHSKAVRDGVASPQEALQLAVRRGFLERDAPYVTVLFVNAIEGRRDPGGRSNGSFCLMTAPLEVQDTEMEAFCLAHEIGHSLGLKHAVDDPRVDASVPSIMGDGPFAERIGPSALQPPQIETVRSSRFLLKRAVDP